MSTSNVEILKYSVDEQKQRLNSVDLNIELDDEVSLNGKVLAVMEELEVRVQNAINQWKTNHSPIKVYTARPYSRGASNPIISYAWVPITVFKTAAGYLPFSLKQNIQNNNPQTEITMSGLQYISGLTFEGTDEVDGHTYEIVKGPQQANWNPTYYVVLDGTEIEADYAFDE